MTTKTDRLFQVTNHHVASAETPPHIDDTEAWQCRSYLENGHGDQFIFVYDSRSHEGLLYSGDSGWEKTAPAVDGEAQGAVLSASERAWLKACWDAALLRATFR